MSEILERMAAFDPTIVDRTRDGFDGSGPIDAIEGLDGLAASAVDRGTGTIDLVAGADSDLLSRVSVAGFQVHQAAEGLEQAESLLRVVEALARDADARVHDAQERAVAAERENHELSELLEIGRAEQAATVERAEALETRTRDAEERLRRALERVDALEARVADRGGRDRPVAASPQPAAIVGGGRDVLREAVVAEIRRPLTSILGLTLALKHVPTGSSDGRTMIRDLGSSARRLERLVGQIAVFDGISCGSYVPNRRRADVEALVRRVVEASPESGDRDVRIHTEHVAIEIDPALTEQMVEALLANAARRSASGDPVWVDVASEPDGVVIAVDDTCSETPAGLPRARGGGPDDGPAASRPGVPSGLVLLTRLAELHGGTVWVERRPGGGSSFRLFLPATGHARGDAGERDLSSFDDLSDELAI